jgi:hypothetical protein
MQRPDPRLLYLWVFELEDDLRATRETLSNALSLLHEFNTTIDRQRAEIARLRDDMRAAREAHRSAA